MNLRMIATYPASDGSMPESVEVEWSDIDLTIGDGSLVLSVLDRMFAAARERQADAPRSESAEETHWSLDGGADKGDLLGLCPDGLVRRVNLVETGTPFLIAGKAAEKIPHAALVAIRQGEWVRWQG